MTTAVAIVFCIIIALFFSRNFLLNRLAPITKPFLNYSLPVQIIKIDSKRDALVCKMRKNGAKITVRFGHMRPRSITDHADTINEIIESRRWVLIRFNKEGDKKSNGIYGKNDKVYIEGFREVLG